MLGMVGRVLCFAAGMTVATAGLISCKQEKAASSSEGASSDEGEKVVVPSDPKATYYILQRAGTELRPVLTTKRVGPSGTSYTRRECDCTNRTWRYVAEGDTLAELESSPKPDDAMGPLVDGSIADVMWSQACSTLRPAVPKRPNGIKAANVLEVFTAFRDEMCKCTDATCGRGPSAKLLVVKQDMDQGHLRMSAAEVNAVATIEAQLTQCERRLAK
jgi:hypothetical protein